MTYPDAHPVLNFVGGAIRAAIAFNDKCIVKNGSPPVTASDIPDGFQRQTRRSPLTDPWEPIYSKQTPDAIILGLRLATPHTNARGFVHGGLIAALTDKAMGHSCGHKMGGAYSLVTVSMSIDFISSAQIGQWLTVESGVIKTGSTLCFAQCFVTADGNVIARANGTFRVVKRDHVVPGRE